MVSQCITLASMATPTTTRSVDPVDPSTLPPLNTTPTLGTLMTTPAITARIDEPLVELVHRMHEQRVGSIVVVDGATPVGIVTERDVLGYAAENVDLDAQAAEAMTTPLDTIELDTDPRQVLVLMRERGYRHLPVLRNGELVGIVSLRDLMRVAAVGPPEVPRGLKGVVVADTDVGDVRGTEGFYHYRQYSAIDLARTRPLEDVWQLMIDGALPASRAERDAFAAEVAPMRRVPPSVGRGAAGHRPARLTPRRPAHRHLPAGGARGHETDARHRCRGATARRSSGSPRSRRRSSAHCGGSDAASRWSNPTRSWTGPPTTCG